MNGTSFILELLFFFLISLIAEILGTIGGFGSSLFFVSAAQFFFDFQTVLALTGLLHIFSNTSKIVLFGKTIEWKLVLWMGVPSVLLTIVGAYLSTKIDFTYARFILGILLIGFSSFFLWKPKSQLNPTLSNSIVWGGVAGFLAGFIGSGYF